MQVAIIENNARRNGEIVINGWKITAFNGIKIEGSEKQVVWCHEILNTAAADAINAVGKAQKVIINGMMMEADEVKFLAQVDAFLAQAAAIINGAPARVIIDNQHSIQAIIAATKTR